jgi:hypothetical protein
MISLCPRISTVKRPELLLDVGDGWGDFLIQGTSSSYADTGAQRNRRERDKGSPAIVGAIAILMNLLSGSRGGDTTVDFDYK